MKPVRVDEDIFSRIDMDNYTMESKYDGFRCLLSISNTVKMYTREMRFMDTPECLVPEFQALNIPVDSIFDGEIWNVSKRGAWRHDRSSECQIVIWDVIKLGGKYLNDMAIEDRRSLVRDHIPSNSRITPISVHNADPKLYKEIRDISLEHRNVHQSRSGFIHGVVLKKNKSVRRDHPSRSIEHPDWMKIVFL